MNGSNDTTRRDWLKAYRLARLSESCSDDARSLAGRHVRYVAMNGLYIAALTAIAALLVNFRCSQYARTHGRLPA